MVAPATVSNIAPQLLSIREKNLLSKHQASADDVSDHVHDESFTSMRICCTNTALAVVVTKTYAVDTMYKYEYLRR